MAKKIYNKFPCSQKDFYSAASTAWRNYLTYVADFTAHKAFYTDNTAIDAQAALDTANRMPDAKQRNEASETARKQMIPLGKACIDNFVKLKSYIDSAYSEDLRHIKYEAAGQQYYADSVNEDWDALKMLCITMGTFITDHSAALEAGNNMPNTFGTDVTTASAAFNSIYEDYKVYSETGVATQEKLKALNACYDTMNSMLKDGKVIFRNDEAKQELFVFANLVAAINPTKASLEGLVQDADTDDGLKNAVISVKYANEPVIMVTVDSEGYYSEELKGGTATVTIMAPDYLPESQTLDIPTGKNVKLDVKLKKAA